MHENMTMSARLVRFLGAVCLAGCSAAPDEGTLEASASALKSAAHSVTKRPNSRFHARPAPGCGGNRGGSGEPGASVELTPNAQGWVDASSNSLGVQGAFYPYSDGNGPDGLRDGYCEAAGHADSECSIVTSPDPALHAFPNTEGRMCLVGNAAQVLPIVGGTEYDYANIWGAGLGLDLAYDPTTSTKGVFDAAANVVGVSFDIDGAPADLRVEFPTLGKTGFDAYWGASPAYPASPVVSGTNVVLFSEVQSTDISPVPLDTTQLQSIQFHVFSTQATSESFAFCISHLKLLLQ